MGVSIHVGKEYGKYKYIAVANALFGVYQDWIYQNIGTHLDGGIDENGQWQAR